MTRPSIAPGFTAQARAAAVRASRHRRTASPATSCMKTYSDEEFEVLKAVASYQRTQKRKFPTVVEIFTIIRRLGYRRAGARAGAG
jgi:hypothetical protein